MDYILVEKKQQVEERATSENTFIDDSSKKGLVLVSKVAEYCGMGKVVVNTLLTLNLIPFH